MVNLPKLFKPFYTISEAFNRLNLAGAGLDKKEDLFLLADQDLIELSLVIYGPATLIKASAVEPYYLPRKTRLRFEPDQDSVSYAIESLGYSSDLIEMEKTRINNPSLVIPKMFLEKDVQSSISSVWLEDAFPKTQEEKLLAHQQLRYGELEDSGYEDNLIAVYPHEPAIVRPLRIDNNIKDQSYGKPRPYKFYRPGVDVLGYTAAVELHGESYYVCEATSATYFSEMVDYVVKFKNDSFFRPIHKLNHALIFQALRDIDNYVVTREQLQNFEQIHLVPSDYVKAKTTQSTQKKREEALKELIDESGLDAIRMLGRKGTWDALTHKNKALFGHKGPDTINSFFNRQNVISYR